MALTPDDVVNKRFQPTKFREGYDQDEVDDFLDEVVEELRRLNKENDDLRAQLAQGGAAAPAAAEAPAEAEEAAVPAPVAVAEPAQKPAEPEPTPEPPQPQVEETPEPTPAAPAPAAAAVAAPAAGGDATSANGLLAMAQKVHDDYVTQGATERDRLVSEAQGKSQSLVAEAEAKAKGLVSKAEEDAARTIKEAEETRRKTLEDLEGKKTTLEGKIDELRGFERDYRSRLTSYIQGQLKDLEATPVIGDQAGPQGN
jgi:DivIVA domain-containing protein